MGPIYAHRGGLVVIEPAIRHEEELEELVDSYRLLADVVHQVLSDQSLDTLLDRIADALGEIIPYDALTIYEADAARGVLEPVLARDDHADQILQHRCRFGEGLTGWAAENRQAVLANQAHLDARMMNVPGTPLDAESLITVPLVARGEVSGALNLYRVGHGAFFTEYEFELAKRFADVAALSVDNAKSRAALERQAKTDSLTGLYNHRFFHERLRAELSRTLRSH
ncbi:MAG: hypothetical protein QOF16_1862, partial [Actinomycetota bacterium]|nr:hypothetical protein [Actinomycetota bacterium]